ncbi:hypothetical protein [Nannocystis sp.]|uniref:hypothetical protein n=1 Tax=Nannocystis sp. TaxID=1962667 RepID=UPI0034507A5A|nr:hypothetical protein [Nannocystis sp.]
MPTPASPLRPAPAELAARRRRLLALHRRHAGRVRALVYWFGAELEAIDDAVLQTFLLADRHARTPSDASALPWLARLAWRVTSRSDHPGRSDHDDTRCHAGESTPAIPVLPPAADLLARLLAVHAPSHEQRAAFILAELAGLSVPALAVVLGREPDVLRGELTRLRRALADDREVLALGGPRALLLGSLTPFVADPEWQRRHAARLIARLPRPAPSLADTLRRPPAILALGLAAIAVLLLLRPAPPAPRPRLVPPPVVRATPLPPAPVVAPPLPVPVPPAMPPEPASPVRVARKPTRRPARPARDRLAEREQLAKARDPGAIIIELEMIGAGRKALAQNPRQALAYAEQHARDYPQSQLATQRAELRVRALCALGRRDEARSEANRAQVPRVQDALREACKP